ncbi:beta-ketoacyl synthase domain-containing protein [Trichoderma velutinum]
MPDGIPPLLIGNTKNTCHKTSNMAKSEFTTEPIAIVGSSCRFPGSSSSPSKLWELLKNPRDILKEIPESRFNPEGYYNDNGEYHGSTNVRHSYLLDEDFREFDHNFFNIHPKEAESMDPQQRMLLEIVFECIEAAGYSIQEMKGSQTAIFVGQMTQDYSDLLLRDVDSAPQYAATGISRAILSNRVSYFFDWKGPSSTIDTACSSSLVALHHAVQTLRSGESSLAMAAGVNLILGPDPYILESKLHMLSPTGRSRMWDAGADGYARGEGFASVLLKTLSQAIADGDHIECIIRETGVNQDGRTSGITMPSSTSQTALIRSTYARAGLDWRKREDRCQYFEAHGTGTMAGDPIEARAVRDAFFPENDEDEDRVTSLESDEPLYVGSIKTVIGHLEGTAGLAGLLKASLAIQNGIIPPNMHFNKLNPKISPFYTNLHVPTKARAWPTLPPGTPRRASVNSFGFGGTNAHVILESWTPEDIHQEDALQVPCGPLTLSANTEKALLARARHVSEALKTGKIASLSNLAWTMQCHRTQFPYKMYVSSSTAEGLIEKLDDVESKSNSIATKGIHVTEDLPARILGVFTGQGAQWPSMGRRLYEKSATFKHTIDRLDDSLKNLPDAPSWSLVFELIAPPEKSRIHEAAISQPLCTALQVALVDLLYASGITFSAVVGHSSGEIGAAYAAGYIKGADAIRIAYYRGVHAHLAGGADGQKGKMMAVGMGLEQARTFCSQDKLAGRIHVAASNSRSSVTLSGDADAIDEAKELLDSQQSFARLLKVDKAYHSHHMQPCAGPYLESLQKLNIQINTDKLKCKWYSSVYGSNGRSIDNTDAFKDTYWVDNMVKPVLFSQAIDRAVTEEHCHDIALEVGPHFALKAPASESLKNLTGLDIPYTGVLSRGQDDMEAFSDALGFIWSKFHSPSPVVDFAGFRKACFGDDVGRAMTLKDLPPYPWDHASKLWKESRKSRMYRSRKNPIHELLGYPTSHGNNREVTWRNVMRIQEMEWLRGHIFQNQVLFPAAGYVSMAYEASIRLASEHEEVRLVELEDLIIHRAITLEDDAAGTEVTFTIRVTDRDSDKITAEYSCYSCKVDGEVSEHSESTNFTGRAIVRLGKPAVDALPPRIAPKLPMKPVGVDRLYKYMEQVGLRYTGDFTIEAVERRLNVSTVTLKRLDNNRLRLHPATLDAAFHGIFTALAFPGDGQLWTPYLPTNVRRVRINPAALEASAFADTSSELIADCYLRDASSKKIQGDVDITSTAIGHPQIQLHALTCSSFTKATPQNDRKLFAKTVWKRDIASGIDPEKIEYLTEEEVEYGDTCERLAYFYHRRLRDAIKPEDIPKMDEHFQIQFDWIVNYLLPKIEAGQHPRIKKEWVTDTAEDAAAWRAKYPGMVELQMISALGEVQPSILRGELPALQVMMQDDMLTRLYAEAVPFRQTYGHLVTVTSQLAHRYPRMKVLEIGAGTGGASVHMLKELVGRCYSYTYTDISAGFFEAAQERFREYSSMMDWAVLDIERDPLGQGFEEHSFDVIMSSNALHATKSLKKTLAHCRTLLKAGGYLILNEVTNDGVLPQFISSHLPGWWLGRDDGRVYCPTTDEGRWNRDLLATGFSGVDAAYRDYHDPKRYLASLIVSQAVDERINVLRDPTAWTDMIPRVDNLIIIGGQTPQIGKIAQTARDLLRPIASKVALINRLEDVREVPEGATVLVLSELDIPTFQDITPERFSGIQSVFKDSKFILWATQGCRADNPLSNMVVGLGRAAMHELPNLRLQFLDVDTVTPEPRLLAETLLRTICINSAEFEDVLWADEWELAVEKSGLYIPRIVASNEMNDRLNSVRRDITSPLSLAENRVEFVAAEGSYSFQRVQGSVNAAVSSEQEQVKVHTSSLLPVRARNSKALYLCLGSVVGSGRKVAIFTSSVQSVMNVPMADLLPLPQSFDLVNESQVLLGTLIAESIISGVKGRIWVHDADVLLAKLIADVAAAQGTNVFFSTSSEEDSKFDPAQVFIHSYANERDIISLIPEHVEAFVNLGQENSVLTHIVKGFENPNAMRSVREVSAILLNYGLDDLLKFTTCHASTRAPKLQRDDVSISVAEIKKLTGQTPLTTILNWNDAESVDSKISPLRPSDLFAADKTYLLVGLASQLGMSICDWMVKHGARNLVVTSRSPGRVDTVVLEDLRRRGANVKVLPLDITDQEGLLRLHKDVSETMPPIAGVANAAMVLNDKLFTNMSLEDFQVALRPKVKGTQNLDELFYSTPLDFFICFSSLTCVMGNPGQSNYAAANMYMHSLVRQRKQRGVAASIIDIAFLLGVGFVDRNLEQYEDHLKKFGYMRISEPEFHGVFAEAIAAGRPTSEEDPEIIIGIGEEPNAPWYSNPRFATYVRHESNAEDSDDQQAQSSQSVKGRLAAAKNNEDALAILQGACAEKLAMILQVHADVIDHSTPLLVLGIDSLVSVEIRSWFLKEVNVDMPVLKILSGASLAEICQDALVLLPPTLISSAETSTPAADASPAANHDLLSSANIGELKIPSSAPTEASNLKMEDNASALMSRASTGPSSVSEMTSQEEPLYERVSEMTPGQSRLYFLNVYLEDKATYNVTMSGKLQGPFEISRLKKALSSITRKHEGLRTSFFLNGATGKAMQGVSKEARITIEHKHIQSNAEIQVTLDAMKTTEFNLETGVWMKIQVLSLSSTQHHIIFTFHHIALDGVSWAIFLSELNKAYAGGDFSSSVQQAIDLVNKQQRKAAHEKVQNELQFWKDVYHTLPEPLPLFSISRVQCRQLLKSYDTETLDVMLPKSLVSQIKLASGEMHVTSFHFYLSSIAAFVSRCLGVNDFSIGILDANRATAEDMTTMGYFTNILPLRFKTTADEGFSALAKRTRDITLAALSNSNADFDTILDLLKVPRSGDQNPLFQIAVNYRLGGSRTMPLGNCEIEWTSTTDARNPYDLIIDISEIAEGTIISFTTQRYLYSAADTEKLLTWFTRTVEGFANDTSRAALDCLLATPSDIENAISLGCGESLQIEWKAPTLAHRVQEIASQNPDFIAVKDGYGQQLTYSQMMQRVSQIASQLSDLPAGSFVGILLHPAADTVCTLMAILTLGLVAIIYQEETQTTAENLASTVEQGKVKLVCVSKLSQYSQSSIQCAAKPEAPGFAIYTSGSTGAPKGVLLTHYALLNQIWAITKVYRLGKEVVLQQSSSGFDLHLEQIFSALANGGTVVVASKEVRGDALEIANLIFSESVTYTVFVPSEYLYLLNYGSDVLRKCASWKFAFSGGEKVTPQLRQKFKKLGLSDLLLINLYGPAEASLSCTRYTVPYVTDDSEAASPAGMVQPNYTVVVVDERGNSLPIGFPGEICIGGAGVASGYVNRPEETTSKFIANTISPRQEVAARVWDKLYRTGDRGRMLESGLLDFMGRLEGDSQVKIRGIRIELEEIGNIIIESAGAAIVDTAVSLRGSDMLSAFVVFSDEFTEDKNVFLSQLRASLPLPAYMCPTHIIAIDEIPRNASGKKDRSKINHLPLPSVVSGEIYNEGLTDLEAQVIAVWQDVLPAAIHPMPLSADSDFFFVGGNSLLLLKLRSDLKMAFGCDLTLPELFQVSTVRDMASKIKTNESTDQPQDQNIDWTKELRSLCDGLTPQSYLSSAKASATKSGLSVILTGATGFLGRHILQYLVNDERVGEIHCVAIRPGVGGEPRHVDMSSAKIIEYAGDLGDRNLGLSSLQLNDLVARADVIVHNGADVSFMKTYRSLRRPNVLSTRCLAEMALARSIPFHFVSTASVANFHVGKHLPETSIQGLENLPRDGRNGYAASKWISEALLESLADDHGVRSWIHRPTSIIGVDAPEMDIVASLYNYSKLLKAVPRFSKAIGGTFDFISVQSVANSIADAAVASVGADGNDTTQHVSYQHHCSDEKVPIQDFGKYMEKTEGGVFDELESKVWFEKARQAGLNRLVCEYLESTVGAGEILSLPTLLKGKN